MVSYKHHEFSSLLFLGMLLATTAIPYASAGSVNQPQTTSGLVTPSAISNLMTMIGGVASTHSQNFQSAGLEQSTLDVFGLLASSSQFQKALQQHGVSSFSWGLGYNFKKGLNGSTVGFVISWANGSTVLALSWEGFLGNSTVVGPAVLSWPTASHANSVNWAGYETWQSGDTIDQALATPDIPTISNPPTRQISTQVHQVGDVWVGMAPQTGGGGGLIQTGFDRDVTSNTKYQFWWELYPSNFEQLYTSAECGNGNPYGSAGDSVQELVSQSSGSNNGFSIYDITSNVVCTASYSHTETPVYATAVVEAFTYCTNHKAIIQQIAELGSTVTFGSGSIEAVSGNNKQVETFNFLHNQGWYNTYTLQQNASVTQNIQNGYSSTAGGPTMAWKNSWYNYNYVNGNPPAC